MRYYWLRDRVQQKQFRVRWQPGVNNQADYFTKHHPPSYHRDIRPTYLHEQHNKEYAANATERIDGVLKPRTPDPEQSDSEYKCVTSTSDTHSLCTLSEQGSDVTAFNAYPYIPYTNIYGTMQVRQNATIPFYGNHHSVNSNGFPNDVTYSVDE